VRRDRLLRVELVTETYPPDVNGVALTVQALGHGLRVLGHSVGIVRPQRDDESPRSGGVRRLARPGYRARSQKVRGFSVGVASPSSCQGSRTVMPGCRT